MLFAEFLTKELGRTQVQSELRLTHPADLRNVRSAGRYRAAKEPIRAHAKHQYAPYLTLTLATELERSNAPIHGPKTQRESINNIDTQTAGILTPTAHIMKR